jgi:uncharacterized protein (TIGR02145 family)
MGIIFKNGFNICVIELNIPTITPTPTITSTPTPTSTPAQFCPATTTDYDGNVYNVVQIGNQCWTSENLKNQTYQNGTPLTLVLSQSEWTGTTSPSYSYYNGDLSNKTNYGLLYNGYAITGSTSDSTSNNLCPVGWHIPILSEFQELSSYLGGNNISGGKMKISGTTYWDSPNIGADNSSGFSARGSGILSEEGNYEQLKQYSRYWTTDSSFHVYLDFNTDDLREDGFWYEKFGISVRCVKNVNYS